MSPLPPELSRLRPDRTTTLGRALSELNRTHLALDHHAIVSITDPQGVITSVNDRFCAISGYARDELIGHTHSLLKSGRHDDALYRDLWSTIQRGEVWHGVICNRRKGGGSYWVQSTIVPLTDEAGAIEAYISLRTDITERVLAQEQSSLLSQVLDRTDQAVVVMGIEDGRICYANAAAGRAVGLTVAQLQGCAFDDFIPPMLKRRCRQGWQDIRNGDFRWEGLLPLRRHDGKPFLASSHVGVLTDATGRARQVFNIFSDYAHERERQSLLIKARRDAEQASAAKSSFLSSTSHELRTPLNAILGFAQLLALYNQTPQQQLWIKEILRAGQHLVTLIDEILDLSRIESGADVLHIQHIDIGRVCRDCLSLIAPLAAERQIRLREESPLQPSWVLADNMRLKQVILNLLSNAVKYSPERSEVTLRIAQPEPAHVRVAIEGHGAGIPPQRMGQLFEPFNRLGIENQGIPGTGIGLAISKKLIDRMQGRIGACSTPGEGSTFWIELKTPPTPMM